MCHNRACVNPAHMEPVTHAENLRRGDQAKLTHEAVAEIKAGVASGETQAAMARQFGVHKSRVSRIIAGKAWA